MDEAVVREHAQAMADALVAGDIDQATTDFSDELRRNLGEVLALLPLPATSATVESVERGGSGFNVVTALVSDTDQVQVQTRWKDRDGSPKVVEASHLSRVALPEQTPEEDALAETGAGEGA
jgi:hypothetical protein